MPIPCTQVNRLADYPGSFVAPPLALLPPAEVAEDGQDQRHDAPDGQIAEGGARSPSEPDDACKEEGEHGHEREGERESPTNQDDWAPDDQHEYQANYHGCDA